MQQIVFKREFLALFDAVKTKNVQYLEENMQARKKLLKILILRNPDRF